jgi:hypothetical protein
VGTSDPFEFIEDESQRIPFKAALSKPMNGKMLSKIGPRLQSQVGETSTRGCLMMTALKQAIGTTFALPIVWNYPWLKHQKIRIF